MEDRKVFADNSKIVIHGFPVGVAAAWFGFLFGLGFCAAVSVAVFFGRGVSALLASIA